jgi:hypothetical protein
MLTILAGATLAAVVIMVGFRCRALARTKHLRDDYRQTVRAIRWWMIPAALAQLLVVVATMLALAKLPFLSFGWWRLLGGTGNIALGQTHQPGLIWRVLAFAVPIAVVVIVPMEAHSEEMAFRFRAEKYSVIQRLRTQFRFGIMHCLVGIPIAAGLALTLSGLYYLAVYLHAIRQLGPEMAGASEVPRYERLPYPRVPATTAYDPEAWRAHDREREGVRIENERRLNQWLNTRPAQAGASIERVNQVRRHAATKAAAAHAVSNWLVIIIILFGLVTGALS